MEADLRYVLCLEFGIGLLMLTAGKFNRFHWIWDKLLLESYSLNLVHLPIPFTYQLNLSNKIIIATLPVNIIYEYYDNITYDKVIPRYVGEMPIFEQEMHKHLWNLPWFTATRLVLI